MKRSAAFVIILLAISATAQAQISTRQQQDEQDAIDAKTPKLNYKEEVLQLLIPGYTMGETVGVSTNSQNHVFVYTRTNPQGIARGGTAAMLWEFDQNGQFVRNGGLTTTPLHSPTPCAWTSSTTSGRWMKAPA